MKLKQVLSNCLSQIRANGRSEHAAGQCRRHITLLATWLEARHHSGSVEEICHEDLAAFLASPVARSRPDGRGKKATSTNAVRTSRRTFFRYAHEAGYTRSNPARLIRRALCGSLPPRALADEEQGCLLLALAKGTDPEARRDHVPFALMLGSGIRLGSALVGREHDGVRAVRRGASEGRACVLRHSPAFSLDIAGRSRISRKQPSERIS